MIAAAVLRDRGALAARILDGGGLGRIIRDLALLIVVCAAAYGAVLGMWHGARLAAYDAVKLPLVLLVTATVTVGFSWIIAVASSVRLRFDQVAALTFLGLGTASVLLVSLAPVAWFFTICAPAPSAATRAAHNGLYLMHTGFVAACGLAGTRTLWNAMRRLGPPRTMRSVYVLWVLSYALAGGQVAWALRPFVGSVSPQHPVVFLRDNALRGNVYEFIGTDIVPYFWSERRR